MPVSKAQIFNIALNTLGISTPLENADSQDNRAILLNNYYNLARDCVLKDFDWNFASVFRELSLCDIQNNHGNFKYCYDYPNDCICARDVFEKDSYTRQKFTISSLDDGKIVILTDVENAVLRYTRRVDKEVFFSCEFAMAISYYLASLCANVLVGSIQKGQIALEAYKTLLKRARVLNASEDGNYIYDDKTYLDSRS